MKELYKEIFVNDKGMVPKKANYPQFVDKGGRGPQMWISDVGGRRMWIRKFLNVNIIFFEKVDKPEEEGGGA